MKIAGILCEYDPFHGGHALHIARTRQAGADRVVCVMSGSFTQRGEAAAAIKQARAAMALRQGADLVIELPVTFSLAPAERFARGGMALLDALGCVDTVSFGSEGGELEPLRRTAVALEEESLGERMRPYLQAGEPFAAARQRAAAETAGAAADCLRRPNDTLAVEYLRALARLKSSLQPLAIRREGAHHGEEAPRDGQAAAGWWRARWQQPGRPDLTGLPQETQAVLSQEESAGRFPVLPARLEPALLGRLRLAEKETFARLPDMSEGLHNRLWQAVRDSGSWREILGKAATKRYPLARIRRLLVMAALGLTADDWQESPRLIRVLGLGPGGAEILRTARQTAKLPLVHTAADLAALSDACRREAAWESRAVDLQTLGMPRPLPCGSDWRTPAAVIRDV